MVVSARWLLPTVRLPWMVTTAPLVASCLPSSTLPRMVQPAIDAPSSAMIAVLPIGRPV
ncbi:hypothetical protein D3C81_2179680 [compost metagenome]